jgi:glycosyltransferase
MVVINCKNGARSVRRCLEAALGQTFPRVKILFQDGGSTDGTLDIVRDYIQRHPGRIHLYDEPDSCAGEGFYRALKNACSIEVPGNNTIIAVSNVDEERLPDSAAWGVEQLRKLPLAGAVYGDVLVTDIDGEISGKWIASPFSLEAFIRREVDPPLAASFFRREALIAAGVLTRNWNWATHEYELWLRIALKYPIHYVPGLVAKYAFHSGTISYGEFHDNDRFVAIRKDFIERFFSEESLPESIQGMKDQALTGLHLFLGEVLHSLKAYPQAHKHLQKAMDLIPNSSRLVDLAQKMAIAGQDLRIHILAHLAYLPPRRIVCYGAGNDFMDLLAAGVFDGHSVVAVVDNLRPRGELVGGVPVIPESGLGQVEHDMVVVTSSKWAHQFRAAATLWSIRNVPYVPVI